MVVVCDRLCKGNDDDEGAGEGGVVWQCLAFLTMGINATDKCMVPECRAEYQSATLVALVPGWRPFGGKCRNEDGSPILRQRVMKWPGGSVVGVAPLALFENKRRVLPLAQLRFGVGG